MRKTRNSIGKNGASKRGQTADEDKNKKIDYVAAAGVVPHRLVQQKLTVSLQVNARCDFLNCEAYNASLAYVKHLYSALP